MPDARDQKIGTRFPTGVRPSNGTALAEHLKKALRAVLEQNAMLQAATRSLVAQVSSLQSDLLHVRAKLADATRQQAAPPPLCVLRELESKCLVLQRAFRRRCRRRRATAGLVLLRALRRNRFTNLWDRFLSSMHRKRYNVVKELVDTETAYMAQLTDCVQVFCEPLAAVLGLDAHRAVFSNIQSIHCLHKYLSANMRERLDTWAPSSCIADLLVEAFPRMGVYEEYINNYDSAAALLDRLVETDPEFRRFVEGCSHETMGTGVFFLKNILVTPVQRLPRYKMLLANTSPAHPDWAWATEALESIAHRMTALNESKRVFGLLAESPSAPRTPRPRKGRNSMDLSRSGLVARNCERTRSLSDADQRADELAQLPQLHEGERTAAAAAIPPSPRKPSLRSLLRKVLKRPLTPGRDPRDASDDDRDMPD
eukprot:m51a1_g8503 hypothetical protein (426) ;mRNA; r:60552-61987